MSLLAHAGGFGSDAALVIAGPFLVTLGVFATGRRRERDTADAGTVCVTSGTEDSPRDVGRAVTEWIPTTGHS